MGLRSWLVFRRSDVKEAVQSLRMLLYGEIPYMRLQYLFTLLEQCSIPDLTYPSLDRRCGIYFFKQMILNDLDTFGCTQVSMDVLAYGFDCEHVFKKFNIDISRCDKQSFVIRDYHNGIGRVCVIADSDESIPLLMREDREYVECPIQEYMDVAGILDKRLEHLAGWMYRAYFNKEHKDELVKPDGSAISLSLL